MFDLIPSGKRRAAHSRGFTLIELLVVIAITAILMTLIIIPIIQSFNLTRSAQGFAEAQDRARTLVERIGREINNSVGTRDNSGQRGALGLVVPARPGSGSTVPGYDPATPFIRVPVYNAKLDIVQPAEGDPTLRSGGAFVDPWSGMADPTLKGPKGQINLPASPGLTLVRYFIGLRDPFRRVDPNNPGSALLGYLEPYSGLLQQRVGLRDNLYVLYRAEVRPLIWSNSQNRFVVNKAFFFDLNRDADPNTTGPLFDDPTFFDPTVPYPNYDQPDPDGSNDPTKAEMVQNWVNAAVIQTEVDRYDMIQPVYNLANRQVVYDGDAPRLMTLVQFRPTRVSSEPAEGQMAVRLGQESEGSGSLAPDVYFTKFAAWTNTLIRIYPTGYNPAATNLNEYQVGLSLGSTVPGGPLGFSIYMYDPDSGFEDVSVGTSTGVELMDLYAYRQGLRDGFRANFSRAIMAANSRSGWLTSPVARRIFEPYYADFDRGRAIFSWGIDEVGTVAGAAPFNPVPLPDPVNNPNNLPGALTWPDQNPPLSPMNDPNLAPGVFSDAAYSSINRKFNKVWHDFPGLRPDVHRFIDLRVTPNSDGEPSPLDPNPAVGYVRARIVPGSEQVFGPDQNEGPNYGRQIRYTRTTRNPGPNQYRINYVDLQEPDYALLGFSTPPGNYTATDFVSAVIQPRYKAGYIQLNSDPNVPLPGDDPATPGVNEAQILVYYRFQFTQPQDVVSVDYDSRQLLSVALTIRNYPQSTVPNPQSVTLRTTAKVRNFLR